MTTQEINEGIKLICETSNIIQNCYESKQALADEINNAKKEDIEKCWHYYEDRSGVVVDVRKELFKLIREGNIVTAKLLDDLVAKYKKGKENQFRVYKNFYTIFYPAITFYGHSPLREFVKNFENKLIVDLGLENEVKTTSFDFQGPRQQGSDRYWLAIYNKEQQNQSTGIQFFIDFHHGSMSYGVYKHGNRDYLKERVVVTPETFSYDDLLVYFKTEVNDLINDLPKYDNITSIDLGGHNLYKISHGTFKAKNKSHVIDSLKENNWITLHENTGKDQSRYFKEELHEGDYVYITLGSKELIGIAKIVSEEWDYVPYDIVDAEGWMFREVEFIKAPVRKNPKDLKDSKNIFPSGNSTLTEIRFSQLDEANDKLFKPYFNVEFYNSEIVTSLEINPQKLNNILKPLNQILYGPPGTGKTYNSINKAIEIINPAFDLSQDRKKVKDEFDRLLGLGQIVFTTFHQSMSYEDFIEGIKPKVEEDVNENKQVVYEIEDGIFKQLVENAKKAKTASKEIVENYTFVDAWNDLISEAENNLENTTPLFLPIQTPNLGLNVVEISERGNLKLKPIYSEDAKEYTVSYSRAKKLQEAFPNLSVVKNIDKEFRGVIGGSNSTAYWSILNFINHKINQNQKIIQKENILPALPHVLIIDEINRGNVSQIFGELITLIEDSKRIGEEEALEVTLSYSKKKFGVPSNVYIIGTMNTADRSVEALDTALRRRFSFVEMMPDYEIKELEYLIYNFKVTDILKKINTRIEMLLGRDYVIGHSYFLEKTSSEINEIKEAIEVLNLLLESKNSKHENFELKIELDKLKKLLFEKESSKNKNDALNLLNSFDNNIIPLLQEYFYNDYGKIGLILGRGFVREKAITSKNDKSIFADFDTKNEVDITKSYELIPFTEIDFEAAINTLLGK